MFSVHVNMKHSLYKLLLSRCNHCTAREMIKTIPIRKGLPLIGTSLSIMANGSAPKLHLYIHRNHQLLGPIFRENMGTTSAVFISDPSMMRQIFQMEGKYPKHFLPPPWTIFNELHSCKRGLFFMDGEEWLYYRRMMNKHFLKDDILNNLQLVHQTVVQHLVQRWRNFNGSEVENIEHEFYRHSISFLMGSLLGSNYIQHIGDFDRDVEQLASIFHTIFETTSKLNGKPARLMAKLSLPGWRKFEIAVQSSLGACREVVEKMMKIYSADGLLDKLIKENLPMNIMVAIVVDLLLAAGDTTAITSQWSLYLLSGRQDVQAALEKGECDVKYVVKEALRLYPPAIFITRTLPEQTNISGYTLSKNELVLLSLYSAGRNEKYYPSADDFKPDRWVRQSGTRGFEGVKDARAYIPFAIGVRSCIGKSLALAQLHHTLNGITTEFNLERVEEVDMFLRLVPVPSKPIRIRIKSKK